MGQLWIERPDGQVREDGLVCQDPRNHERYIGDIGDYRTRLASFRGSPYEPTQLPKKLANAGFYYTGHRDVVKCWRCGQCVENFVSEDNPHHYHWHHDGCEEVGDGRNNNNQAPLELYGAMQGQMLSEGSSHNQYSNNQIRETAVHTYPQEGASSRMEESYPQYTSSTVSEMEEDTGLYEAFACLDPFTPGMANLSDRARTFSNYGWNRDNVAVPPEEIARAGFIYTGVSDHTRCWYCNGCLQNWAFSDDPWEEHAKWFPNCEHLLRHRGPDYVHGVVSRYPDLRRPGNEPPPLSQPVASQPSLPALPRVPTPMVPRPPRQPVAPRAPRLPQPPAPPIPPTHSSQNTVQLPGGITLSLTGGVVGGSQPAVQVLNNGSGHTFTVRTRRGTVITYNYGGNGGTFIQMGGSRRNQQPPEFVDPRQEEQKHLEQVNNEMTSSPIVADVKNMGFDEETIRIVLLSKFLADGQMFESVDDLLDTLTQYQQELARIEPPESSEGATSSPSTTSQGEETGTSSTERELRRIQESRNCRLCHRELATVVLMPCAHLAVCVTCAARNIRVCPVCKRMVNETIRSYIS